MLESMKARTCGPFARLRAFLLTDSTALLILGAGIVTRGVSYTTSLLGPPPSHGSHPAEAFLPIPLWGSIWIIAGGFCLAVAFSRSDRVQGIGIGLGVALNALWGVSFVFDSLGAWPSRSWVSSVGYISIVLLVLWAIWRGKRGDVDIRQTPPEKGE